MNGMTLLPQELPVTQEGAAGLFPTKHRTPLIILHGQVTVRLQNVCKMLAEQGLRSGTDGVPLFQCLAAAHGNPCALGSEAFHMVLFLLEQGFGNQQGHIHVFNTLLLELLIHDALNIFPDCVAIRTINKHALNGGVIDQLCLLAHICEPLTEVHFHICDLFNFLILCHNLHPLRLHISFLYYSTHVKPLHRMEKTFAAGGGLHD